MAKVRRRSISFSKEDMAIDFNEQKAADHRALWRSQQENSNKLIYNNYLIIQSWFTTKLIIVSYACMKDTPPAIRLPPVDACPLSGPFWGELRVFLAVAKSGSYSKAAEYLNSSQPTISRQVRRLQDVMGVQLVIPNQTGILLTHQGEALAHSLRGLDQQLFDLSSNLNAESRAAEGSVSVSIGEAMVGFYVVPELSAFNEKYPRIKLQFYSPQSHASFRANKTHIMVSAVEIQEANIQSRAVGYLHLLPMASKIYIERFGMPTRDNLASHHFIQASHVNYAINIWKPWLELLDTGSTPYVCDNLLTYSLMIKNGLGIGLVSTAALADPMMVPLDLGSYIRTQIYMTSTKDLLQTKAVQVVYDWLTQIFSDKNPWFSPELKVGSLPLSLMIPTLTNLFKS
jgi:DNA-binding transcriptional LysR family regulator